MFNLTEQEAEEKIKAIIPETIKSPVIEVIKREPINKIEYSAVFAVIFKYSKETTFEMTNAAIKLAQREPAFDFSGSDVDDKFNLVNGAVFLTAKCIN